MRCKHRNQTICLSVSHCHGLGSIPSAISSTAWPPPKKQNKTHYVVQCNTYIAVFHWGTRNGIDSSLYKRHDRCPSWQSAMKYKWHLTPRVQAEKRVKVKSMSKGSILKSRSWVRHQYTNNTDNKNTDKAKNIFRTGTSIQKLFYRIAIWYQV